MTNAEAIKIAQGLITDFKCESETMVEFCNTVIKALSAEPQKMGKWISHMKLYGCESHSYQCSVCGRSIKVNPLTEELTDYPYCHCGVKIE